MIRKEIIKENESEFMKKEFAKVSNAKFSDFKSNIETKVFIFNLLKKIKKENISVLEVGAGYGDLSYVCLKLLKIKDYTVTEINKNRVSLIRDKLSSFKDVKVKQLDILYPDNFDRKYDVIIFSEVLEHLTTIEKELAFVNMNKFLNKGGYLIVTCPITEYLGKRFFYARTKGIKERSMLEYKTIRSHIAVPSVTKVIGLFYRKGFDKVKIMPLPILLPFKKKKWIEFIINIAEFFLKILPNWLRVYLSPGIVFLGKKKDDLDDKWYNDTKYLLKHLPEKKVSEDKMYESFVDYKRVEDKE